MRATCNLRTFRPAFQVVASACGNKNLNPVLGFVLIEFLPDGSAKMIGTDNQIGVTAILRDFVADQPGLVVLEAAKVAAIIAAIPQQDAKIVFDFGADATKMKVEGGGWCQTQTRPATEHPGFSVSTDGETCQVQGNRLVTALKRTMIAASKEGQKEGARQQLGGIQCDWVDGLRLSATDGRRIAIQKIKATTATPFQRMSRIIPVEIASLAVANFGTDEEVKLSFAKNFSKVSFECGDLVVAGSLLVGTFPDYDKKLVAMAPTSRVPIFASELRDTLSQAVVVNSEETRRIIVRIADGKLLIISPESLGGCGEWPIAANYSGEPFEASLPGLIMLEGLKQLGDMAVEIGFSGPKSVVFFDTDDFSYIVMPIGA